MKPESRLDKLPKHARRTISRRMSDVIAQPIAWLWPGRIARGKVTVIAGHPGLGKSQITAHMAAIVSKGGQWPDRQECEGGSVIMISAEDDAADTIRPRLEAARADLSRIHTLDFVEDENGNGNLIHRSFNLDSDVGRLEALMLDMGDVRLVVIDPITAFLGGIDSYKNADVRALLTPLADLAGRYGASIIGVSHLSKAGGQKALLRVSGSLAFVAAARAAYLVAADETEEGRRLLLPLKNNLGPDQTGFSFRFEEVELGGGITTSRIVWDGAPVAMTADDVLSESPSGDDRSALEEAKEFLAEMLDRGPVEGRVIYRQADDAGHAKRTVDRAKRELGIQSRKSSMTSPWRWELPTKVATATEHCHQNSVATLGNIGNLREATAAAGIPHQCNGCRHFTLSMPEGGDDLDVKEAGWCSRYAIATDPLTPTTCNGYSASDSAANYRALLS